MSDASLEARCGFCGRLIVQRPGGGHPRGYCDDDHRRRAQRRRDHELRAAVPGFSHRFVAAELVEHTDALAAACFSNAPLDEVLRLVARVVDDAECVAAAAVGEERSSGCTWADIGRRAGVGEGRARARWGGSRLIQRFSAREPAPWSGLPRTGLPGVAETAVEPDGRARRAAATLGRALRTLREHSAVSLDDVAAKVEIPLCAVHWLVEGQVVAPWSTTYTLVHLLGGQPEDLYLLWRSATKPAPGVLNSPCLDGLLAAGLRGARLAAGQPTAASACPPGLTEAEVEAVFAGRLVPEWSVLCELLLRLDADPDPFEELWTAHQAARRRRSR